jgi:hypothetical protein
MKDKRNVNINRIIYETTESPHETGFYLTPERFTVECIEIERMYFSQS